jgi:hypothetical protein
MLQTEKSTAKKLPFKTTREALPAHESEGNAIIHRNVSVQHNKSGRVKIFFSKNFTPP